MKIFFSFGFFYRWRENSFSTKMSMCFHFQLENKGGKKIWKIFQEIQRSEASRRNGEEKNIAYQILARDTERRKGWRSVWIYISKNRLTISLIVDATKLNEYINKIRRRRYLKKVPCIMGVFLLIFFNLVGS